MNRFAAGATVVGVIGAIVACGGDSSSPTASTSTASTSSAATTTTTTAPATTSTATGLPAMYARFQSGVTVSLSGMDVVLRTTDVPPHPSPYFGVGDARYVAPQAGMVVNPNRIIAQNIELRVPAAPAVAGTPRDTTLGTMGVAVNGVVLFNAYAAGMTPLDAEIRTFDQYNGHPQQQGVYHYHIDPVSITGGDATALVGVLLDGFPVYGAREMGGGAPTGLDSCNGHTTVTPDHPGGIYHYHVTAGFPYMSGCFKGTPGRATN